MLRFFLMVFGMFLMLDSASANEESVVSLFEDADFRKDTKNEPTKDESGIFSFFNFSVPDKLFSSDSSSEVKDLTIQETIKLADRGDLKAQMLVGFSYLYGDNGLPVDYTKAFEYYAKAALQNDPVALNNLGSLYYGGIGVKRDSAKAGHLFKKSADMGNHDAAVNIGFMHASGNGARQDPELALKYFESALPGNSPAAKYMVGYAYFYGKHREKDYTKAAQLIKDAADAGFDEAQSIVAKIYLNGLGFPQNYTSGVNYMHKAVKQGDTGSMMLLADILAEGKKYTKDPLYAHTLYNIAAVRGVAGASEKRNEIESKLKIDEIMAAQKNAATYKEELSEMTSYIRNTYGRNIGSYLD